MRCIPKMKFLVKAFKQDRRTDTQTNATESITMPHTPVATKH